MISGINIMPITRTMKNSTLYTVMEGTIINDDLVEAFNDLKEIAKKKDELYEIFITKKNTKFNNTDACDVFFRAALFQSLKKLSFFTLAIVGENSFLDKTIRKYISLLLKEVVVLEKTFDTVEEAERWIESCMSNCR